jgi:hypothetical protein
MGATPSPQPWSPEDEAEDALARWLDAVVEALPDVEDDESEADVVAGLIGDLETGDGGSAPPSDEEAADEAARPPFPPVPPRPPRPLPPRPPLPPFPPRPPRPPADVVVRLDALEVTQEIQDLPHSVPLVAGKATIVRAYLSRPGSAITVRGELRVSRSPFGQWHTVPSLGTAELDPSRQGATPADLRSRRAELRFSLNFRLPSRLVASPGLLWLRLGQLRRQHGNGAVPSVAHVRRHHRRLGAGVPFRLRLVLLPYTLNGTTHTPTATDVAHLRSYLRRAYPVSRVLMTTTTVTAAPAAPFDAAQINAQLQAIRAVDVATGTDARTHYYGMVSADGFFMRGLAAGIPGAPQPGTVASGPTGNVGFSWDTDGSWGDWYGAHELGHTLGRRHAEFCGAGGGGPYPFANGQLSNADEALVGIDDGETSLGLPLRVWHPITSHDVMSYCEDQWLSSFTYEGIYDRLVAEDALPAGATPGVPAGAAAEATGSGTGEGGWSMRLFASVNLDRSEGSIAAVLPEQVVGAAPDAGEGGAGEGAYADRVRAQVLDASGAVLDERPVPVVRSSCEDPDQDVTGTVDATLPDVAGAAQVQLLVGDVVVAAYTVGGTPVSPSAPRTLTTDGGAERAPAAEPGEPGTQVVHLAWDAAGAPGSQRYIVQVSSEPGTWSTVAVGVTEPWLDLPVDDVDGDELEVKVLATTGTGVVEVRTERVRLR